jgi:hypothetical protein
MKIETKYKVGDEVAFYKTQNQLSPLLKTGTVGSIDIHVVNDDHAIICYKVDAIHNIYEDDCFPDIESLKKYLKSKLKQEIDNLKINDHFHDNIKAKR